jgi:hypothetical protein
MKLGFIFPKNDHILRLKLHVAVSETQKIVGFALRPGSIHNAVPLSRFRSPRTAFSAI